MLNSNTHHNLLLNLHYVRVVLEYLYVCYIKKTWYEQIFDDLIKKIMKISNVALMIIMVIFEILIRI